MHSNKMHCMRQAPNLPDRVAIKARDVLIFLIGFPCARSIVDAELMPEASVPTMAKERRPKHIIAVVRSATGREG